MNPDSALDGLLNANMVQHVTKRAKDTVQYAACFEERL